MSSNSRKKTKNYSETKKGKKENRKTFFYKAIEEKEHIKQHGFLKQIQTIQKLSLFFAMKKIHMQFRTTYMETKNKVKSNNQKGREKREEKNVPRVMKPLFPINFPWISIFWFCLTLWGPIACPCQFIPNQLHHKNSELIDFGWGVHIAWNKKKVGLYVTTSKFTLPYEASWCAPLDWVV